MLDTKYRVEIPGGIDLEAQVVGPVPRFLAFAIDFFIRGGAILVGAIIAIPLGGIGMGFLLIAWFMIEWFYPVLFEVFRGGQTPGKKALGIAVVHDDLTPVSFGTSLVRNLLRSVDFLPVFYLFGLTAMVANRRFQRLGDMAAGTLVVSIRQSSRSTDFGDVEPIAPTTSLSRTEQTAMVDFLYRGNQLSPGRQEELANILVGITHRESENGVLHIRQIGAWLLGVR